MGIMGTSLLSQQALHFVLLGLATGSLTALVALGIVLVYRTTRVLNFSAGALGAVGAYVCYDMRSHNMPVGPSVAVGLVVGVALGLFTYGVMALLREASHLAKLIATLGLFSAFYSLMYLVWGYNNLQAASLLPTRDVTLWGGQTITLDRLILIGIALACAIVLKLVYTRTLFGLATSAVAENRRTAASAGWSPNRIELANFAIAGGLSALAAILLAPIISLDAFVLSAAVIPALAAALVGRFSSFGITVGVALVIGIVQNEIELFQNNIASGLGVSSFSLTNLSDAVPLVIILGYMVVTGRSRLQRGESVARLPFPGTGLVSPFTASLGVITSVLLLVVLRSSPDWSAALITTFAVAIILCSVVVVAGYAGQLSLCQFALAGVGAWIAAQLVSSGKGGGLGLPFEVGLVVAVAGTAILSVVVALLAGRTRGISLAVATLALALVLSDLIFQNPSVTGGLFGLTPQHLSFAGVHLNAVAHPATYGAFVFVFLVVVLVLVANLRRGRVGARMLAVRSNERAAASLGIGVLGVKVYAFGVAGAIAALGGVMLAMSQQTVDFAGTFSVVGSLLLIQYAVVGGLAWVSGTPIAAGATGALGGVLVGKIVGSTTNELLWLGILAGLSVLLVFRLSPDGVAALNSRYYRRVTELWQFPRPKVLAPEPPRPRRPAATLAMTDLVVNFGGVVALDGVSFEVRPGEVLGLIGPNGAGKTTLLDVVSGFTRQSSGTVRFGDAAIDRWSVERRARAGVVRSWQGIELFDEMTVAENLLVAAHPHSALHYLTDLLHPGRRAPTALMAEIVGELGLESVLEQRPSSLSHGTARLVGIARALLTEPAVLLLDEPAAGLGSQEMNELGVAIRNVAKQRNIGVLVVEHDVPLLLEISDRIVVLDFGRKIAEGPPDLIATDAGVVAAYLGDPSEALSSSEAPSSSEIHGPDDCSAPGSISA